MPSPSQELVALTWAQRAQSELGAAERFRSLIVQMGELGVASPIILRVEEARVDEVRHAKLCSSVALHHGHPTGFAALSHAPSLQEKAWDTLAAADRLLCEVTLMCCLTETINASLLNTLSAALDLTCKTGRIMKSIFDDEVMHGQIGWMYLASASQSGSCSFLSQYLPSMLDITVKDELFLPVQAEEPTESVLEHGVLPASLRLGQFLNTMEEVVMPGFAMFNIDTSGAAHWIAAKRKIALGFDSDGIH